MTAILGLTLIGGGTSAYFSDSETFNHTFATGILDLYALKRMSANKFQAINHG